MPAHAGVSILILILVLNCEEISPFARITFSIWFQFLLQEQSYDS